MARAKEHRELEPFDDAFLIYTTSYPIGDDMRISICTGWLREEGRWFSSVRAKRVSTNEWGPLLDTMSSADPEHKSILEAHKWAIFETGKKDWSPI